MNDGNDAEGAAATPSAAAAAATAAASTTLVADTSAPFGDTSTGDDASFDPQLQSPSKQHMLQDVMEEHETATEERLSDETMPQQQQQADDSVELEPPSRGACAQSVERLGWLKLLSSLLFAQSQLLLKRSKAPRRILPPRRRQRPCAPPTPQLRQPSVAASVVGASHSRLHRPRVALRQQQEARSVRRRAVVTRARTRLRRSLALHLLPPPLPPVQRRGVRCQAASVPRRGPRRPPRHVEQQRRRRLAHVLLPPLAPARRGQVQRDLRTLLLRPAPFARGLLLQSSPLLRPPLPPFARRRQPRDHLLLSSPAVALLPVLQVVLPARRRDARAQSAQARCAEAVSSTLPSRHLRPLAGLHQLRLLRLSRPQPRPGAPLLPLPPRAPGLARARRAARCSLSSTTTTMSRPKRCVCFHLPPLPFLYLATAPC